ncbi:MAG: hypothetical protein KJN97_17450 [Deltaproteobacteria bacterium]|nr:hypothetical protein [Deltaproteobacteria bacterium]
MSERGSDRRTVVALSVALGAALLLIAFLLGRESAGAPEGEAVSPGASRPADVDPDPLELPTEDESSRRWPAWADLTDENPSRARATDSAGRVVERIEGPPADSFAATQTQDPAQPQTRPNAAVKAPAEQQGSSVEAYFQQVDLIHSEEGAGDPNAFAMDLIKGGLGGASSGFDQLIADTKRMEREMYTLTPPVSCESFHEASIEARVESREMLERMKRAIMGRDIEQLNAIALQSKTLQTKARAMKEMRRQILASSTEY